MSTVFPTKLWPLFQRKSPATLPISLKFNSGCGRTIAKSINTSERSAHHLSICTIYWGNMSIIIKAVFLISGTTINKRIKITPPIITVLKSRHRGRFNFFMFFSPRPQEILSHKVSTGLRSTLITKAKHNPIRKGASIPRRFRKIISTEGPWFNPQKNTIAKHMIKSIFFTFFLFSSK